MKKSKLMHETIMYSINKGNGDVLTHHLPFERGNVQLDYYVGKGFTYEMPPEKIVVTPAINEVPTATKSIKHRRKRKVKV